MSNKMYALAACLVFAGVCAAKDHTDYQKGTLLRMDSTSCGMQEKGSKSVAGELLGTDAQSKKTQEVLCQEYVLQTERVSTGSGRKMTSTRCCFRSGRWRNSAFTKTN